MANRVLNMVIAGVVLLTSCQNKVSSDDQNDKKGTFGDDIRFLEQWDEKLIVLSSEDEESQIIVSPKYQGKVFTSTSEGLDGKSFGWINYDVFDEEINAHMNAYGGEDRLWLGPEGGTFSLFFEPGEEMSFENWHTPPAIDTEEWELVSSSSRGVSLSKNMELKNYAGTVLKIGIDREVELLESSEIEDMLSISLNSETKSVGFKTINTLYNRGEKAWNEETGAPCMWSLDMFTPTPKTVILIPFKADAEGKIATTDYFGEIEEDRLKTENGVLFFKADGLSRGKLGIPPHRVKPIAGSYAADEKVLTVTLFDVDPEATYLNQEWSTDKDPFQGDAMNAYNDGPLEDGSQMGPFYEIESVSPAAFLKPEENISHSHSVFHFTGEEESLNAIAEKVFGVSLAYIERIFDND